MVFNTLAQDRMENTWPERLAYLPRGRLSLLHTDCSYNPAPAPPPFLHPGPVCKPDVPLDNGRSPSVCGPILPGQRHNPISWFEIIGGSHHVHSHTKYGGRLLKPHHYSAVTTIGIKVGPTSQTPEAVRRSPGLTLYHQVQ
jgi:hypothetical protein